MVPGDGVGRRLLLHVHERGVDPAGRLEGEDLQADDVPGEPELAAARPQVRAERAAPLLQPELRQGEDGPGHQALHPHHLVKRSGASSHVVSALSI